MEPNTGNSEVYIAPLAVEDLQYWHTQCIKKACNGSYDGCTPELVLKQLCLGEALLWELIGDRCQAIAVTQILQRPGGKELWLWLLGGRGMQPYTPNMIELMRKYGEMEGCKWFGTAALPGAARVLERTTPMRVTYHRLMMEV